MTHHVLGVRQKGYSADLLVSGHMSAQGNWS